MMSEADDFDRQRQEEIDNADDSAFVPNGTDFTWDNIASGVNLQALAALRNELDSVIDAALAYQIALTRFADVQSNVTYQNVCEAEAELFSWFPDIDGDFEGNLPRFAEARMTVPERAMLKAATETARAEITELHPEAAKVLKPESGAS